MRLWGIPTLLTYVCFKLIWNLIFFNPLNFFYLPMCFGWKKQQNFMFSNFFLIFMFFTLLKWIDIFIWDLGWTKTYVFSSMVEDHTSVMSKLVLWQSFKIESVTYLATFCQWHSSCYPFINYKLFFIFFFF